MNVVVCHTVAFNMSSAYHTQGILYYEAALSETLLWMDRGCVHSPLQKARPFYDLCMFLFNVI